MAMHQSVQRKAGILAPAPGQYNGFSLNHFVHDHLLASAR
jgi:hypothetical protein